MTNIRYALYIPMYFQRYALSQVHCNAVSCNLFQRKKRRRCWTEIDSNTHNISRELLRLKVLATCKRCVWLRASLRVDHCESVPLGRAHPLSHKLYGPLPQLISSPLSPNQACPRNRWSTYCGRPCKAMHANREGMRSTVGPKQERLRNISKQSLGGSHPIPNLVKCLYIPLKKLRNCKHFQFSPPCHLRKKTSVASPVLDHISTGKRGNLGYNEISTLTAL